MKFLNNFSKRQIFENNHETSARFLRTNIAIFMIASALIMSATFIIFRNITETVSKDLALLYSTNTSGSLTTYLNKEISLVEKAAHSKAVTDWFKDEFNQEKKAAALAEMLEIIGVLYSDNMYLAINASLNEYTIEEHFTIGDVVHNSSLTPGYYDDAWYFECLDSNNDYTLNVDVDKILHRKRVWINYTVSRDGVPLGVICSGLEFANTAEKLLAEYDNSKVRGVIIDENGVVQMDSASLGNEHFLRYEQFYQVEDEFKDPAFLTSLEEHLISIKNKGLFESYDPIVINLAGKPYSYATIAPIQGTNWSVITFYNSSSLFSITKLMPLFISTIIILIVYALISSSMSYRLLFKPIELLISSLAKTDKSKDGHIYGTDRRDEIGHLSQTIKSMKGRLDSYNTDLEREVEERSAELKLAYEQAKEQNQIILSSIDYASKIQKSLLPLEDSLQKAFSDYSVMWKPKDIVGGDIYWLKNFDEGTILCTCDCTGHGIPGALLTMLVVSAFEAIIDENNYKDTANIIWELDQKIVNVLNAYASNSSIKDGCDIAVLFVGKDKSVNISNANIHVFICDGNEITQIKGQRLFVGEGKLKSRDDVKVTVIPANDCNKFYISSDGLYDQIGGETKRPFGYKTFKQILLDNHNETQTVISEKIGEAFEAYRGNEIRRDDISFITFKP